MPEAAHQASLLGLVDSDGEDEFILTGESRKSKEATVAAMPPKKGARGRPAANKVTKSSKSAGKARGKPDAIESKIKAKALQAGRGRHAKDDITLEVPDSQPSLSEPASFVSKPMTGRGRQIRSQESARHEVSPQPADDGKKPDPPTRRKKGRVARAEPEPMPDEKDTDDSMEIDDLEIPVGQVHDVPPSPHQVLPPSVSRPPFSISKWPQLGSEHSTASTDVSLRRRLGDLAQKNESLELRYRDLREIGIKEAERNFNQLKKQSEERAKNATELISSLKAELAIQTALAREGGAAKNDAEEKEVEIEELLSEQENLKTALEDAKAEIKMLNSKLAASRSAETANMRYPGSALKNKPAAARQVSNNEAAQLGQIKNKLYEDLTGLIITSVKTSADEDVFDCLQTGRNGTLHFKLSIAQEGSYDDTEFLYNPQLHESRDQDLIEMLPEYLSDEITFPRSQAAKFYARVMKALTEKF